MIQSLIDSLKNAIGNEYLTLYIISIIPIIELRGAVLTMPLMLPDANIGEIIAGMFCCIAGSTTVILPLLLIVRPLIKRMKKTKWFSKLARGLESNLSDRAESAYSEEKDKAKEEIVADAGDAAAVKKRRRKPLSKDGKKFLGLFVFVAIPLPMTGAWTGSCIGSFLDFPIWKAALAVFFGNIIAGGILTALAFALKDYADIFLYGFVVLAIVLAVALYFSRSRRREKKKQEALEKYHGNKNEYELDILKKEADENGQVLIKREFIDENGDRHIIIGKDEKRNEKVVSDEHDSPI